MAKVTFVPNPAGMRQLATSSSIGRGCAQVAEAGEAFAESIAPVDTGEYARSFRVRRTTLRVPGVGQVAGAVLENTAPHAHIVEFHNGDRVMSRTAAWIDNQTSR